MECASIGVHIKKTLYAVGALSFMVIQICVYKFMSMFMLTLYRARLSRHGLCLIMLPEVEAFALILLVVTAGAVDVVVDVAADAADTADAFAFALAFTTPRFFNEPIEPFNKSGLSTSGPPNS